MVQIPGKLSKIEVILQNLAVEAVLLWSYFLRKSDIFFSKIRKKWKKNLKKKLKIINITHSIYALMYVLKKNFFFFEKLKKNIFPNFSQYSEFQWDNGDGDVGGDGEKFFMGKCCENEMA